MFCWNVILVPDMKKNKTSHNLGQGDYAGVAGAGVFKPEEKENVIKDADKQGHPENVPPGGFIFYLRPTLLKGQNDGKK